MVMLLWAWTPVFADEPSETRIVVTEVADGSVGPVRSELSDVPGVDLRSYDWFVNQVESRAFRPDGILDNPSDLQWVMDGGNIDLVIAFDEASEQDYRVRFIIADGAQTEREFMADRGHDGRIRRGGAMVIRYELEDFLQLRPGDARVATPSEQPSTSDDDEDDDLSSADAEALRQQAAADHEALRERLSRDWLWLRANGRVFRKEFAVATPDDVFTYESGGFFGFQLDVEMFPFGRDDPDREQAGFYLNYDHGFYGVTIIEESAGETTQYNVGVNNLTIEGGALYRLDSPLEETNRQIRLKLGGRYENFLVSENPEIPGTSVLSLVVGTRLVLPIGVDEFAVTSEVDIAPLAFFGTNEEIFGADSFSYGFSADLGLQFQLTDSGFLSAGYGFRLVRSYFDGDGDLMDEENPDSLVFSDSDTFDLNHGLRVGYVYQY